MLTWLIINVPLGATWYTAVAGTINTKDKTHTMVANRRNIKSPAYSCFKYSTADGINVLRYLLDLAYLEKDSLRPYGSSHTNEA